MTTTTPPSGTAVLSLGTQTQTPAALAALRQHHARVAAAFAEAAATVPRETTDPEPPR